MIEIPDPDLSTIDEALLTEFLAAGPADDLAHEAAERFDAVQRWRPSDIGEADWVGRKWAAAERQIREIEEYAAAEIERIKAWRDEAVKPHVRKREWAAGLLADYAEQQRAAHGTATTKLPSVVVKTRVAKARLSIVDEEAAAAWAREHCPDAVQTSVKVLVSKLSAAAEIHGSTAVSQQGEVVPGVAVIPTTLNVSVDLAG